MVDLLELRDQLDEDWVEFEKYVEQDENHENPDPRDIPWPNDLYSKVMVLSQAWRVLDGQDQYKKLFASGDFAFPIANMIMVSYIQFPNSNQRVELTEFYSTFCDAMGVSRLEEFNSFEEILDTITDPTYKDWVDWMKARCEAYTHDPHKGTILSFFY